MNPIDEDTLRLGSSYHEYRARVMKNVEVFYYYSQPHEIARASQTWAARP